MRQAWLFGLLACLAAPLSAQVVIEQQLLAPAPTTPVEPQGLAQVGPQRDTGPEVESAPGAVLRGLDKIDALVREMPLSNGESQALGHLTVTLRDCRYPAGDPMGDAYAYLVITEDGLSKPVFSGWMLASAPALNPLDHARYDVWVLRCTTS